MPNIIAVFYLLRSFGDHAATLTDDSDIDLFVGFSWDNNNYGTTGIAWLGTVCKSQKYRTSINEYFQTDLQTAQVCLYMEFRIDNSRFQLKHF